MSAWIETFRGAVLATEYDPRTYMNTRIYTERFDQATWYLLAAVGITPARVRERGRRLALVRQNIEFRAELRGGELLIVRSGFISVGRKAVRFVHRMIDVESETMVATNDCTAVEADLETGLSSPLPEEVFEAARRHLVTRAVAAD